MQAQSLGDHSGTPTFRSQKNGFNTISDPPVTTGVMKTFKFIFLLVSDEDLHDGQRDLLLLKNQASSIITGIYPK
jgi:hypothetical protein